MKKNLLTKMVALTLAVVTALTPVTASAAEKNVVTKAEFGEMESSFLNREERTFDNKGWMNYIASLDGSYQENGYKIYTVLNGATKTFKKTGKYSIVVYYFYVNFYTIWGQNRLYNLWPFYKTNSV